MQNNCHQHCVKSEVLDEASYSFIWPLQCFYWSLASRHKKMNVWKDKGKNTKRRKMWINSLESKESCNQRAAVQFVRCENIITCKHKGLWVKRCVCVAASSKQFLTFRKLKSRRMCSSPFTDKTSRLAGRRVTLACNLVAWSRVKVH